LHGLYNLAELMIVLFRFILNRTWLFLALIGELKWH